MRNLVVNAIEYGEGRPIEVRVAANAEAVALSVRDHGLGLRPGEEVLGLQPVLASRPGPGQDPRRHRARPVDRRRGHRAARRQAGRVGPAGRGIGVPAHAAQAGRHDVRDARRCRSRRASPIRRPAVGGPYARYDADDRESADDDVELRARCACWRSALVLLACAACVSIPDSSPVSEAEQRQRRRPVAADQQRRARAATGRAARPRS